MVLDLKCSHFNWSFRTQYSSRFLRLIAIFEIHVDVAFSLHYYDFAHSALNDRSDSTYITLHLPVSAAYSANIREMKKI
jgi:hypothetical protein